ASIAGVVAGLLWSRGFIHTNAFVAIREELGWLRGVAVAPTTVPWWYGALLAAVSALIAAALLYRRARHVAASPPMPRARWRLVLWLVQALLVTYAMRLAYTMPPADERRRLAWDNDDIQFVPQALDYAAGLPISGREAAMGHDIPADRTQTAIVGAPLVAVIARATGVSPAALHHSVLPPLLVLLGWMVLLAAFDVLLRRDPWRVAIASSAAMLFFVASWDHYGSLTQYLLFEAAQPKGFYLLLLAPLQVATLALVLRAPTRGHVALAAIAIVVGFLVHLIAAIFGLLWCGALLLLAVLDTGPGRRALRRAALTLCLLCSALAIEGRLDMLRHHSNPDIVLARAKPKHYDLARDSGGVGARQDPRMLFGGNLLFALAAAAVPMSLALGRRRRELKFLGAAGAVGLAFCTLEPVARIATLAMPTDVLWRLRWVVPSLLLVGVFANVVHAAVAALVQRWRRLHVAGIAVAIALAIPALLLWRGGTVLHRPGVEPARLDRFDAEVSTIVTLLGGERASPYVLAPYRLQRQLSQLMPHMRSIYSMWKWLRAGRDADWRGPVLSARGAFDAGNAGPEDLAVMLEHYAIDRIIDRRSDSRTAITLRNAKWRPIGSSDHFTVWAAPEPSHPSRHARR
ncbi:MAG TPA: DUF6077 domain-containing protein, partial [Kofleriaceae bacterium]